MKLLFIIAGVLIAYCLPIKAQQWDIGVIHQDTSVINWRANTRTWQFTQRTGIDLITEGWYRKGYFRWENGIGISYGKAHFRSFLVSENDRYFFKWTIGYKGGYY